MYDFYLILILINVYNFTFVEAGSLISIYIFGQALSFKIGLLFDYLSKKMSYSKLAFVINLSSAISYFLFTIFLILLLLFTIENELIKYIIFGLLLLYFGLAKNIYNDGYYRKLFKLVEQEKQLENFKSTGGILSEVGHVSGYIIFSIVYYYFGYIGTIYLFGFLSLVLLINSFNDYKKT